MLLAIAVAAVAATRSLPMWSATAPERAPWGYEAANGKTYPYLIGMDSYSWVRKARNYLASGSPCDVETADGCRDRLRHAPVGSAMPYADSLHIRVIAWLHRFLTLFDAARPIDGSAFWVQVVVGTLGVVPAWLVGCRLGGPWAGFLAALLIGMNPGFFDRSLGADNDVWNVVLPLYAAAAVLRALDESRRWRRITWAVVAAGVIAMHAAIWRGWTFGFVVLVAGIFVSALPAAIRAWTSGGRAALAAATGAPLLVAACFVGCTLALTAVPHGPARVTEVVTVPDASPEPELRAAEFPDGLRDIGELQVIGFERIRERLGGTMVTLGALLGLVVLVLPTDGATPFDLQVVAGATAFLALGALTDIPPVWLGLGVAIAIALLLRARARSRGDPEATTPGLLVAVWLAAALYMSLDAQRWLLLAVPPVGLAYAGGAGRVVALVRRRVRAPAWQWIALAVLATPAVLCAYDGFGQARAKRPDLTDAWWDSLREIDASAPPNTIVSATWPYGYWIEYVAQRGANADGSSVLTHIPHWMARALLSTDPDQSLGLLRMLDCGSDAWHEPEARLGAYERLRAAGADGILAHDLVLDLARLDRAAADRVLESRGYPATAREQILESTHCTPPPAYLLLSDTQARQPAIRRQGTWDPRRATIAHRLRALPEAEAISTAVTQLGLPEAEARAMYLTVRRLHSDADLDEFIAPTPGYFTKWVGCRREAGARLVCDANVQRREGLVLERFTYPVAAGPHDHGTLHFRQGGRATERPPDALVVADASDVRDLTETAEPEADGWGVLLDLVGSRVTFGPPYLIRSMLTRLAWLGRAPRGFEKVADRQAAGERAITWRITWPAAP